MGESGGAEKLRVGAAAGRRTPSSSVCPSISKEGKPLRLPALGPRK